MKWSALEKQSFRIQVEQILHVPGNFTQEILEMALVTDLRIPREELKEAARELAAALKRQGEVFQNVRLNLVEWRPEAAPESRTVPLSMLALGRLEGDKEACGGTPEASELLSYLKLFQARSKLILVLSAGNVKLQDEEACRAALRPFLGRKLLWISLGEEEELLRFLQKERCRVLSLRDSET